MPDDPVEDFLRGVKGAAPAVADPVDDFLATAKAPDDGGISAGASLNVGPDRPEAISGAFREPKSKGSYLYDEFRSQQLAAAAAPDTFPVSRESRARLIQAKDVAAAERGGNPKWAEAVAAGGGPSTAGQFSERFPNIKTQEDADFAEAQMGQSRRASRTAEQVADASVVENVAKKSPLMRGVLNAGTTLATFGRAATGGYFGGLIGNGERQESAQLDKLNAALEDADGWTKYLHAGGEGIGAGVGIGGLARGIGIGKAMATYGAVATPGGVKERTLGAVEMRAFGALAQFLTPSTQKMLARLPEYLRGPVIAKAIDLADEFAGGVFSEASIRVAKGEDVTAEALVLSGFLNAAQASLRKVVVDAPPAPDVPAPEAPARPVETPTAEVVPEATPPAAEPVAAPDSPAPAPEAPAAPREEVIQPRAGEPTTETPPAPPPGDPPAAPDAPPMPTRGRDAIKNRVTNEDRAAVGLPPLEQGDVRPHSVVMADAEKIAAKFPNRPAALAKELLDNPRPHGDTEVALLLIHKKTLNADWKDYDAKGKAALADGDAAAAAEFGKLADAAKAEHQAIGEMHKATGKETARGLSARQMESDDYSPLEIIAQRERANNYKDIGEAERARAAKQAEDLAALEKTREETTTRRETEDAHKVINEIAKTHAPKDAESPAAEYGKANKIVTREAYEATKKAIQDKLNRLNAGIDPTILVDLAKMGAFHIEAGARTFGRWSAKMRKDFGEKVEPHLRAIYDEARKQTSGKDIEDVAVEIAEGIKGGKDLRAMAGDVGKLAEALVRSGVHGPENISKAIHDVLKKIDPNITQSESNRILVKYGQIVKMNQDPVRVELRDTKAQLVQIERLQDMAKGIPPPRQGLQHDPPSDALREWNRKVEEAKRKGGFKVVDPVRQLKTTLDGMKTRWKNEIKDKIREIEAGKRDIATRTDVPLDAEAKTLKAELDALRERYREVFTKPGLTDAQRLDMAIKAAEKSVAELERRAKTGDVFPAAKEAKAPTDPRLIALHARRKELRQRVADIRDAATPKGETADERDVRVAESTRKAEAAKAKAALDAVEKSIAEWEHRVNTGDVFPAKKEKVESTDPKLIAARARRDALREVANDMRLAATPHKYQAEIDAQRLKTRLASKLADLTEQLATGNFKQPKPQRDIARDKEDIATEAAIEMKRKEINEATMAIRLKNQSVAAKALRVTMEGVALARVLKTTFDFSLTFLQGGLHAVKHPVDVARALGSGFKAFGSKGGQAKAEAAITLDDRYSVARRLGRVAFSGHGVTKVEEMIRSRLADNAPIINRFQRFGSTFMNRLRLEAYKGGEASMTSNGRALTPLEARTLGSAINVFTGRGGGETGRVARALDALNNVFFAPRWTLSRFQTILGTPLYGGTARTRRYIGVEYARSLAGIGMVYGLAAAAGAEIDLDKDSPNFGTIKVGDTHIDLTFGLVKAYDFLRDTGIALFGDDENKRDQSRYGLEHYARGKLAPIPGAIVSRYHGKTIGGEEATWGTLAREVTMPLTIDDVRKIMVQEMAVPSKVALSIMSMFGARIKAPRED